MIAFSYDLGTGIGQARLYAGDTDPAGLNASGGDRTRTDEEIAYFLRQAGGDVRLAAAAVLQGKAAEYATQAALVQQGTLRQDYRERSQRLLDAADALRAAAGMPLDWNPPAQPAPFSVGTGGTMADW